uniref:Predicted gene 12216 n=1 Tax=Mus spicilegus TaxID=10103 RepID=A0A8C6MXN8_MUSSI
MDSLLLKTCLEASPECWSAQRLRQEQLREAGSPRSDSPTSHGSHAVT